MSYLRSHSSSSTGSEVSVGTLSMPEAALNFSPINPLNPITNHGGIHISQKGKVRHIDERLGSFSRASGGGQTT